MNELVDEACGRVLDHIAAKGWLDDTDVFFTTDHGEMQGDYGFLYKGPYHTDSLMRLPLHLATGTRSAGIEPAEVTDPVGQLDLAATFCDIAGLPVAEWIQGRPLPTADGQGTHERVLCEWRQPVPRLRDALPDHLPRRLPLHRLRALHRRPGQRPRGERLRRASPGDGILEPIAIQYDGTEGDLDDVEADPHQRHNLWDDPAPPRSATTSSPTSAPPSRRSTTGAEVEAPRDAEVSAGGTARDRSGPPAALPLDRRCGAPRTEARRPGGEPWRFVGARVVHHPPRRGIDAPLDGLYNECTLTYKTGMATASHVMTISRNGQVSIPAEARSRWKTRRVVVVDLGDRVVMRPLAEDAVGELEGKYRGRGPDTERARQQARRADAAREQHR
ncbi:MAG: sulfatase-like hydrolase/transferase [Acidimicrobiia bacterium]|nr:sulfatase-like hydrolase/transferase [Acidimicrobiia bacterium]